MKQICVIGVGYVGIVTGACFADLGNRVVALDVNEQRIENLKKGIMPIYEPGLDELVKRNVASGRLTFTTSYAEAVKDVEYAFIAVGTPSGVNGEADLQYVAAAATSIAQNMTKPLIIINKSTVPIGTGDWVADIVRGAQKTPIDFAVVSCPEFLREGSAIGDFMSPHRNVIGTHSGSYGVYRALAVAAGIGLVYVYQRQWTRLLAFSAIVLVPFAIWQIVLWQWFGQPGIGSGGDLATPFEIVPLRGLWSLAFLDLRVFLLFAAMMIPLGATMVSSEGACAAYFRYRREPASAGQ